MTWWFDESCVVKVYLFFSFIKENDIVGPSVIMCDEPHSAGQPGLDQCKLIL